MSTQADVVAILAEVLHLGARATTFDASTPLLGSIAELDSMAVVTLITRIEEQFGFVVNDDDVSAETFESVGSLTRFVDSKLGG